MFLYHSMLMKKEEEARWRANKWDLKAEHKIVCGNELQNTKSHNSYFFAPGSLSRAFFPKEFLHRGPRAWLPDEAERELSSPTAYVHSNGAVTTENNQKNCSGNNTLSRGKRRAFDVERTFFAWKAPQKELLHTRLGIWFIKRRTWSAGEEKYMCAAIGIYYGSYRRPEVPS